MKCDDKLTISVTSGDPKHLDVDAYARVATAAGQDLDQASRWAIRAVVYSDNNPRMMDTLAQSYLKRKQYRKAVRWLEKAALAAPENPYYQKQLADLRSYLESKPFLYRGRGR